MDKIIDFLNSQKNCKFDDLQFFSAKYYKEQNLLKVVFSSQNYLDYDDAKCQKIGELLSVFVEKRCDVAVKVKQLVVSSDTYELIIKSMLEQNALYKTIFDVNSLSVEIVNSETLRVKISVDKDGFDMAEREKFEQTILDKTTMYGITHIDAIYSDLNRDFASVLDIRREELSNENVDYTEELNLSFVKLYLGKMDDTPKTALLPEQVLSNTKNIFVAGIMSDVTEHSKLKGEEGNQKESKYYKFVLSSEESKIDCVCFAKKGADLLNLENGQKVVVLGDSDEFRGTISLRVRALSLCKFDFPKKQEKTANKYYKVVKPERYIQQEQINFLQQEETIKSEYLLNNTFVVFDLETTGLNFNTCKIIEIGAVKIVKGQIVEQFSTFVNPECHIPEEASNKNHITDDMVRGAPTFAQVFPDFYKFIEGSTLVAHNINFDFPFISYYAKPLGYIMNNPTQDTLLIAQKYLGQLKHFNLAKVCEFLGVSLVGAHRAVNDTVATAKVFIKLMENYENKNK